MPRAGNVRWARVAVVHENDSHQSGVLAKARGELRNVGTVSALPATNGSSLLEQGRREQHGPQVLSVAIFLVAPGEGERDGGRVETGVPTASVESIRTA